ncbi:hypothetical protein [Hoeflea marina]|uniref:hypothetical protein n=1 Tax=Hoeflea marina TaxID=274592 RepID=UPI000D712F2E|nr:hypothetical protein [Hoeflea marina]
MDGSAGSDALAEMPLLPFDRAAYAPALRYLGDPAFCAERPLVMRPIPGSADFDAFGPFPYSTPPVDSGTFLAGMAALGAVTWTAVMRPGWQLPSLAGFDPLPIKEHFVHRRLGPALAQSPRARKHIRRGLAIWTIDLCAIAEVRADIVRLHGDLEARAPLSRVARVDAAHIDKLAGLAGMRCVVARASGRIGAFLIFAESGDEIHCHLTAGSMEALHLDAMYAIFDFLLSTFGRSHDLYMGGTPAGPNGEGVGRFKARFANARVPVFLARVVLDTARCENLVRDLGSHRWFPPYRDPLIDQGIMTMPDGRT